MPAIEYLQVYCCTELLLVSIPVFGLSLVAVKLTLLIYEHVHHYCIL